ISEKRQRRRPVAVSATVIDRRYRRSVLAHLHYEPEYGGARDDSDERKARCVDAGLLQRGSAEQGITGERDHRRQRQNEKSRGFHRIDRVSESSLGYSNF